MDPFQLYDQQVPPQFANNPEAAAVFQKLRELDQKLQPQFRKVFTPVGVRNMPVPGTVIRFNYSFFKPGHDPQPLVLVASDVDKEATGYLCGINLHYLTIPKARLLLEANCNNQTFSYGNVMADEYIAGAYRTYRVQGVQGLRNEDCGFLIGLMSLNGLLSVSQLTAMVQQVRQMAARQPVPQAGPRPPQPYQPGVVPQVPQVPQQPQ
jgi:hypothetical protein